MKKVLFLMLFLLVLGVAGTNAQVRIGGDEIPNEAAVLDLNADNENDGIKGLALPRVSLASTDDKMGYSDLLEGMLVYNTNISMTGGVGVYYWDGNEWVIIANNVVTSAMIVDGTITAADIANATITPAKLSAGTAKGQILRYDGATWTIGQLLVTRSWNTDATYAAGAVVYMGFPGADHTSLCTIGGVSGIVPYPQTDYVHLYFLTAKPAGTSLRVNCIL